jgi:hypothetical protein
MVFQADQGERLLQLCSAEESWKEAAKQPPVFLGVADGCGSTTRRKTEDLTNTGELNIPKR